MNELYDEIFKACPKARLVFEENPTDVMYYLLGMNIPGFEESEMVKLWTISGNAICKVSRELTISRKGVG